MRSSNDTSNGSAIASRGGWRVIFGALAIIALVSLVGWAVFLRPIPPLPASPAAPASGPVAGETSDSSPSLNIQVEPRQTVSGNALEPVPAVVLTDAKGRPAAGVVVQAVLQSGSFAPGSVAEATTDSTGRATFNALTVEKAGAYRLDFSANGYPAAQTAEFVVRFGTPRVLILVREPQGGDAGAPVGGDPAVRVTDQAGNPIPGIDVDVLLEPATGAPTGKLARIRSDGEGLAVFSDIVVPSPGTGYRLRFEARAAGVNNVLSSPFSLTNS